MVGGRKFRKEPFRLRTGGSNTLTGATSYSALAAPREADHLVVIMGYDMEWIQPCSNVARNCSPPALWNPLSLSPLAGLEATAKQFRSLGVRSSSLRFIMHIYNKAYSTRSAYITTPPPKSNLSSVAQPPASAFFAIYLRVDTCVCARVCVLQRAV